MALLLVSLFDEEREARAAADDLVAAGVDRGDIGVVTGGEADTIVGSLVARRVPPRDAEFYGEGLRRGGTLLMAEADEAMAERIMDVLDRRNAIDINERVAEWRRGGWTERNALAGGGEATFPVVQEELQVGKRPVERGGARVHTYVTERPVERDVDVREERTVVDRRPADRPATEEEVAAFGEGVLELSEMGEEIVVTKRARVVEEVVVGKRVDEHVETVRDTVRRTDVEVEEFGRGAGGGAGAPGDVRRR
jgi:uncharacterized protein (TIGR02271 family)